jgi:putative hydrolase of the HAD superfamily
VKDTRHIFFDFDHTLWDFEKNSSEAITELVDHFELHDTITSLSDFLDQYQAINLTYWDRYNRGEIDKHAVRYGRFYDLFSAYGITDHIQFSEQFADKYLELAPTKKNIFPYTHEVLTYLRTKYKIHLITNGFKEVLAVKMAHTGLHDYFDVITCSEDVGVNKPHPKIFQCALENAGALASESLMIGDSFEADIEGAEKSGIKAIHFNPKKLPFNHPYQQINCLSELKSFL